jgi:hypothetical protein
LDRVSDERIPALEVPTGIPLVYELDVNLAPRARYYLGDFARAREAQKEIEELMTLVFFDPIASRLHAMMNRSCSSP